MKRKRWRVKTHYCARFGEFHHTCDQCGPLVIRHCLKCGRIKNWRDIYPLSHGHLDPQPTKAFAG